MTNLDKVGHALFSRFTMQSRKIRGTPIGINRLVAVGLIGCALLGFIWVLVFVPRDSCTSPFFIGWSISPGAAIESVVQQTGGLPKSNTELTPEMNLSSSEHIYVVDNWSIEQIRTSNTHSFWQSITDDDPVYGVNADVHVHYADGTQGVLRWNSWRYGLVLCPLVFNYGDGPTGAVEVIKIIGTSPPSGSPKLFSEW